MHTYKVAQGGVRPEDAFGGDALAGLAEIHGDGRAEKVLDVVRVVVVSKPAGPCERNAAHHECR